MVFLVLAFSSPAAQWVAVETATFDHLLQPVKIEWVVTADVLVDLQHDGLLGRHILILTQAVFADSVLAFPFVNPVN